MRLIQMIRYLGLSFCLGLFALGIALGQGTVTKEEAAQQVQQATEAVKAYTTQQAEAFTKEVQAKLDDVSKKIEDLKQKAAGAPADAAKKYESLATDLRNKADTVRQKMQGLGSVGSATWKDLKLGVEKAVDDLQKAYDEGLSGLK
jgi:hypothetical protein